MSPQKFTQLERDLEMQELKAKRWDWLCANGTLGFSGAPGWNAVIAIPDYDPASSAIEQVVDAGLARDK